MTTKDKLPPRQNCLILKMLDWMIKTDILLGQMKFKMATTRIRPCQYFLSPLLSAMFVLFIACYCAGPVSPIKGLVWQCCFTRWGWSAHITILCQVSSSHPPPPPPQQQLGQVEEKKHTILTVQSAAIDFIIPGDVKNNRPNCSHMWTPPTRLIVFIK